MKDRALFLDRDGTLVQPRHYPSRPEDLVLYDGIGRQLRSLQQAGFRLVVITNQSGIARGYFTEGDLRRMHDHLAAELALRCACRKPEPGLLLRAAADLDLDPARSWFVGDILDDVEAGNRAGCRTILVDLGTEPAPQRPVRRPDYVARSTAHALEIVRTTEHLDRMPNLAGLGVRG